MGKDDTYYSIFYQITGITTEDSLMITSDFNCYKDAGFIADVPVAKKLSKQVLTLPLYTDLELENVQRICDIIKNKQ